MNLSKNDAEWVNSVWDKLDEKLKKVSIRSREKIPYTTVNGVHDNMVEKDITWWTNGFCPD